MAIGRLKVGVEYLNAVPPLLPGGASIIGSRECLRDDFVIFYIEGSQIEPHRTYTLKVEDTPLVRKVTLVQE